MNDSIYINLRMIEKKIAKGFTLNPIEEKLLVRRSEDYWEGHPDVTLRYPKMRKYLAWTAGYQRSDYNVATKKFVLLPRKGERKLIFNRIKGFVKILLAKMNADKSRSRAVPKTSDYEDMEASSVGDRIIEGLKFKLNWEDLDIDAKLWMIICNRVGIRVFWNGESYGVSKYQQKQETDDNGEPKMENGEPVLTDELEAITEDGEIGIEILNPFCFRTDPLYVDRKKWRFFLFGEDVDAEELESEYKLPKGSLTKPESKASSELDDPFALVENPEGEWTGTPTSSDDENITGKTVKRYEFWTPKVWIFIAGGRVLDYGINERGVIPFFVADERTIPISNYEKGIIYNDSMIKDAIPIQREYNRQVSIFSKAIERASKIKILLPENSVLTKKAFSNEFGSFVPVSMLRGKPEQMKLDTLPPFLPGYLDVLEKAFGSSFNVHPASLGQLPERASHASGALLSLLLEQDDIVLDPTIKVLNRLWGEVWTYVLQLVQDNYTTGRYLTYMGDDGQYAVEKFRGTDLKGNTTVRVESQSGLPRSRALKIEYIMTLHKAGLIPDPKDVLEMLEFGTAEKMFRDNLLHEKRALRENERIEQNQNITLADIKGWIHPYEDHLTHIKIHLRDRLGTKAEYYSPNQVQVLDALISEHMNIMISNQLQQSGVTGGAGAGNQPSPEEGSIPQETVEGAPAQG